jgi:hypothetical protein
LNDASVRYLIAGGLAVMAHGYPRLTADIDLILDLDDGNVRRALGALGALGYRPRPPVALEQFADPAARQAWIREKGLTVFSLYSPTLTDTEIDLFTEPPPDFGKAYGRALRLEVTPGVIASFVSYDDLLAMKEKAARPQDVADVAQLRRIRRNLQE